MMRREGKKKKISKPRFGKHMGRTSKRDKRLITEILIRQEENAKLANLRAADAEQKYVELEAAGQRLKENSLE